MKKLILFLILCGVAFTAKATNEDSEKYFTEALSLSKKISFLDDDINIDKFVEYLDLKKDQRCLFEEYFHDFSTDMKEAFTLDAFVWQSEGVTIAIRRNLRNLRALLDRYQYRKYLIVLNAYFTNNNLHRFVNY